MRYLALLLLLATTVAGADDSYPPQSIYRLHAPLTDQFGVAHELDIYAGHPVLVAMFYGTCPNACPLLIETLRAEERAAPPAQREQLRVLLISIDPEHDTPQSLQELARTRHIDLSRWTLARTDAATVRRIAAVLNVQYRQLPDGSFNHSSVITLLSPQGKILKQGNRPLSGIP